MGNLAAVLYLEGLLVFRGLVAFQVPLIGLLSSVAVSLDLTELLLAGLLALIVLDFFFFFPVSFPTMAAFTVVAMSTFEKGSTGEIPEMNSSSESLESAFKSNRQIIAARSLLEGI